MNQDVDALKLSLRHPHEQATSKCPCIHGQDSPRLRSAVSASAASLMSRSTVWFMVTRQLVCTAIAAIAHLIHEGLLGL